MKKILFLSDVEYFKGGAENSLFDLMTNPNIKAELAINADGTMAEKAHSLNIPVHIIDYASVLTVHRPFKIRDVFRTFFDAIAAAKSLKTLAKKINADAVHTNGLKAHGVACTARLLGGKPVISHFRAIPFTITEKLYWHAVRILSRRMFFVSRPCWHTDAMPSKGRVIFNGIDNSQYTIKSSQTHDPFVIGFAGRIQFTKGLDTLVEWFDHLRQQNVNAKLVIRGEAAPHEQEYEAKIHRMVKESHLEDAITFEGFVSGGIENIFKGFDINVVPSVVPDPLPRSIMEACSLGLPVIGYPAGGIPYMIKHNESGFLAQTKEEFVETVQKLIEDNSFYKKISEGAHQNAKDNFSLAALHKNASEEYETYLP